MPRQIASSGTPSRSACPVTDRSHASRSVYRGLRARVPRRAVPDRIDVRAARDHQAIQAGDGGAGLLVVAARRQQDRSPATAAHPRPHRRKEASPPGPTSPARTLGPRMWLCQ